MGRGSLGGYTILEVMIFLVVTAALFVSAITLFNGQQERTRFTQSVRELDSAITGVYNEVASGFYPKSSDFSCATASGRPVLSKVGAGNSATQGASTNCVFLGKVLQFAPTGSLRTDSCSNSDNNFCYASYTVAGRRQVGTRNVTNLTETVPTLAVPTVAGDTTTPDFSDYRTLSPNNRIAKIVARRSGAASAEVIGGFGFIGTFANSFNALGEQQAGGAQSVTVVPIYDTTLDQSIATFGTAVSALKEADRNPDFVIICIQQGAGSNERRAAITIGGATSAASRKFTTDVTIDNVPTECLS